MWTGALTVLSIQLDDMNIYDNIITHQKLSSSAQEQRVLLSYGEQYYEASPAMAELVEELQQHATEEKR